MKYEVYHGRTTSDPTFDYKYVGQVNEPTSDQYGPGFYFTDSESEAARYSDSNGVVIHAMININNPLSDKKNLTKKEVEFMIRNAPEVTKVFDNKNDPDAMEEAFWDTVTLSNISPDFDTAFITAVSFHVGKPALNDMMLIWREHYRYDPDEYLKNLLSLGYDGVIVPSEATIYVVFSPSQIEVIDIKKSDGSSMIESIVDRRNYMKDDLKTFIESLERPNNKKLIRTILEGYNTIKGGRADYMTLSDIAKKDGVSLKLIEKQFKKGVNVEMEHTSDETKAAEIAMDHLSEIPDYYDRLNKMEEDAGVVESGNPMRIPRDPLKVDTWKLKIIMGILSAYKAMTPIDKTRFEKNHIPHGMEVTKYALENLGLDELKIIKSNANDIRDEEKDLESQLKREANVNKPKYSKTLMKDLNRWERKQKKEYDSLLKQAMIDKQKMIDDGIIDEYGNQL